ncbi:MAG: DUF1566 domain-containing protein [Nitrospinae bacterium]|nr:DUF1566 domain-containing protein [Nitrospinota bacterium]
MSSGPRFIDNGDGTIKDTRYNLMWMRNDSYQDLKKFIGYISSQKHSALKYVEAKNKERFAGHADWRLPTKQEAYSLYAPDSVILDTYDMEIHLDPIFPAGGGYNTWTSNARGKITAYVFSYNCGAGSHKETDSCLNTSARLVRQDGPPVPLPQGVPEMKAEPGLGGSWR